MNQQNVGGDAQELRLRARIMQLRENRERRQLNNLERFHRATYPNLLERIDIEDEIHDFQEYLIDLEYLIARNERIRHLQQLGELPPDIPEAPFNPVEEPPNPPAVDPQNARRNRRRRWLEMQMQHQAMEQLDVLGEQEFREQFRQAERRVVERIVLVPAEFDQNIRVEHRQNQDEPRQEDPENRNPEQPRQDEGPENQGGPENQLNIQEVPFNPIEELRNLAAAEDPDLRRIWNRLQRFLVIDGLGPEERGVVVGPEGRREAQPGEQPEGLVDDDGVPHPRNQDEREDQEGQENRNPEEPPQEEGPENQGERENQPQLLLDGRRPAVVAPDAPVVEEPAPEEQREQALFKLSMLKIDRIKMNPVKRIKKV
ncbi:hypothetical protein B9Z55_007203 [Caenorhabditis nigoni]|uniref:Uncharacterized protein n=1 Tax=Caenorhabditis nigoni TaxID=1611254 RepID=A0A2G5V997_9PELO|nr:hypothetical protein B9Z55_007203 [Caenorhabditis nigoni]